MEDKTFYYLQIIPLEIKNYIIQELGYMLYIKQISHAITNKVYFVKTQKGSFILKIFQQNKEQIFNKEVFLIQKMYLHKATPNLVYQSFSQDLSFFILDYQKHNHITNRLLHQDYFLQDLANKLYIFHHLHIPTQYLNTDDNFHNFIIFYFENSKKYIANEVFFNQTDLIHNHYLSLFAHLPIKENEHIVLTHNDINKQNILYKKKWLFFIDFEYSFKSTPYIDFATIYNLLNYNNIKYQKFLHFYYHNSLQQLPKDYLVKTKIYNNILVYTSFLWYCHMFVSTSKLKYKYLANKLSNKVFQIAKNQN